MKVDRKPGSPTLSIPFENPEAQDYSEFFYESTKQLDEAKIRYGANIAYSYFQEWSRDGVKWFDILAKPVDSQGYFTNSFEVQPGLFLNFDSLFRFFNNGKWRYSLRVEIKDCPGVVGTFSSAIFPLPAIAIFEDQKYDLAALYLKYPTNSTNWNFKQAEEAVRAKDEWAKRMNMLLNSYGTSGWREVDPGAPLLVTSSAGSPPCVNYLNRAWQPTEKDCNLELFFVNRQKGKTEYYLVEQVPVRYFSSLKAKQEAEAKAKAEAEAKAKAEAEEKLRLDMKNRCIKFNGDLQLAIFNAQNAGVLYPNSSSIFDGIVNIAPSLLDCDYLNFSTFDSELQGKQRILATLEVSITNGIAAAQANAFKKPITITCKKGKKTIKVTKVNPKCPKGYKKK